MTLAPVECPRCNRTTDAAYIWLWIDGQAERLIVRSGRIQQSGHIDLFDLACGCKFDTELWSLQVSSSASLLHGPLGVQVMIAPKFVPSIEGSS